MDVYVFDEPAPAPSISVSKVEIISIIIASGSSNDDVSKLYDLDASKLG